MNKFLLCLFSIAVYSANGQSNYQLYLKYAKTNDTAKIRTLVYDWEKQKFLDPEFYVCAFNYYFVKSDKSIIQLNAGKDEKQKKENLVLYDSTGKQAGYLNFSSSFDKVDLMKALNYADQGINKFPNRIDLRFGKCHVLQEVEDYEMFVSELKKTIEYSTKNHNKWLGAENQVIDGGEEYFTSTIYEYQAELYKTENDDLLKYIQQIGDYCLAYYPK